MFSTDDRAGNVMTTVMVFTIAGAIVYAARSAFFILLLSLLFASLLEPAVTWVQHYSRLGRGNRSWAIAQIYLLGFLVLGSLGFSFGPHVLTQVKSLNSALRQGLQGISDTKAVADIGARHGVNEAGQQRIHDWLAHNHGSIEHAVERVAASAEYVAASSVWLFVVPILAIFILRDGRQLADIFAQCIGRGRDQTAVREILNQIDTMLGKYVRAQLTMAGLSFVYYSITMLALKFPYAIALGFLGGVLEFLPAVGWITSAATILTVGFLTHAHWIWMSGLLLLWRVLQDYVNSPRILGSTLHLHPLTVLFALMVGGQVGGIAGLYLSVPTVAVFRIVWLGRTSVERNTISHQPLLALKV
jgi:predicted PurR-regulated permease PerM